MGEPENTCPEIDSNIKILRDVSEELIDISDWIERMKTFVCENCRIGTDNITDDIGNSISIITVHISQIEDGFEYCRGKNAELRDWARENIDELKEDIEDLKK